MISDSHRELLKDFAKKSIEYGLHNNVPLPLDLADIPKELLVHRATFVTLKKAGKLRGCIGMLDARRPLIDDVVDNSFAAAFFDSRFPAVTEDELDKLSIDISILTPAEPIICHNEDELVKQLQPNVDGLILDEGPHRATFLPSVWQSLRDPVSFVQHLKIKAGLPTDYWSDELHAYRYTTESF